MIENNINKNKIHFLYNLNGREIVLTLDEDENLLGNLQNEISKTEKSTVESIIISTENSDGDLIKIENDQNMKGIIKSKKETQKTDINIIINVKFKTNTLCIDDFIITPEITSEIKDEGINKKLNIVQLKKNQKNYKRIYKKN